MAWNDLRKLHPKQRDWLIRKSSWGDRSAQRRRARLRLSTGVISFSSAYPPESQSLGPAILLTPTEARNCFEQLNGRHWTIEEGGAEPRRVRVAGSYRLPAQFCFEKNYSQTARMLLAIRDRLNAALRNNLLQKESMSPRKRRRTRYFDLATIEFISPASALVLAAEYDRARLFLPKWSLKVYNRNNWTPPVVATLEQLGFFDLLDISLKEQRSRPKMLQMTRFHQSENIAQQQAYRFLEELAHLIGVDSDMTARMGQLRLYEAIVEATENTMTHAYDTNVRREQFVAKRWWMTGAVDGGEGKLTVVVYDQGATIPKRLPESPIWRDQLQRFALRVFGSDEEALSPRNDARMLRLAMSRPSSSTKKPNQGKGLGILKAVVERCEKGRLLVLSRNGEYIYHSGGRPIARQLPVTFHGTLIQWDLWRPEWKVNHAENRN